MDAYEVLVSLGQRWCIQVSGELEVLSVDRLVEVEPAARAWIAERHGVQPDSFALALEFIRA